MLFENLVRLKMRSELSQAHFPNVSVASSTPRLQVHVLKATLNPKKSGWERDTRYGQQIGLKDSQSPLDRVRQHSED